MSRLLFTTVCLFQQQSKHLGCIGVVSRCSLNIFTNLLIFSDLVYKTSVHAECPGQGGRASFVVAPPVGTITRSFG